MSMTDDCEVACRLIGPEFAARKEEITRELFAHVEETQERDDGYAFRFPSVSSWPGKIVEFIEAERKCCPFFRFEIVFEPNGGPMWLVLTGPAGVKEFIAEELGLAPS